MSIRNKIDSTKSPHIRRQWAILSNYWRQHSTGITASISISDRTFTRIHTFTGDTIHGVIGNASSKALPMPDTASLTKAKTAKTPKLKRSTMAQRPLFFWTIPGVMRDPHRHLR